MPLFGGLYAERDGALEALRDAWRQKKVTMDKLWESAQLCRVANVIRPYLESLA